MKKLTIILAALLCIAMLAGCSQPNNTVPPVSTVDEQTGTVTAAVPTVNVNGEGELTVDPDMATIQFAVNIVDKATAQEATTAVGEAMESVLKALREMGIKDEDMQTASLSLYEQYRYDANGNRTGDPLYDASNTLTVNIYAMDTVAQIVDAGINAGANYTYGISFGLKDPKVYDAEALAAALDNARSRAEALAKAAGKTVGDVLLLTDGSQVSEPVYYTTDSRSMTTSEASKNETGFGQSISPGTLKVTAYVTVRYALQ